MRINADSQGKCGQAFIIPPAQGSISIHTCSILHVYIPTFLLLPLDSLSPHFVQFWAKPVLDDASLRSRTNYYIHREKTQQDIHIVCSCMI